MSKWFLVLHLFMGFSCQSFVDDHTGDQILMFEDDHKDKWKGTTDHWTWKDDILVGFSSEDQPLDHNSFFMWEDEVEDFILEISFRISEVGNSGVYYRCEPGPEGFDALLGYQADIDGQHNYTGIVYENFINRHRKILAQRGQFVRISEIDSIQTFPISIEDPSKGGLFENKAWHKYELIVQGPLMVQTLNGQVVSMVEDRAQDRIKKGLFGFQLHQGPPMKVEFKDAVYTELK